MKVTELSGEHLGMHVVLEHENWSVSGTLFDVHHGTVWIDERALCTTEQTDTPAGTISYVDVNRWVRESQDWSGVEVSVFQ